MSVSSTEASIVLLPFSQVAGNTRITRAEQGRAGDAVQTLEESIKTWQYMDRLTGLYYERFGIVLDREFFGVLTGTLIPPCLAIMVNIIEALFAVAQGVKSISLGYAEQGNS
ncbi:MAG TPA: hypothetical protein VF458_02640 [Ktedonobacteraceae bacterium]